MDDDVLRNSFLAARKIEVEVNPHEARKKELLEEAQGIQRQFGEVTDPQERARLQARYEELDRELTSLDHTALEEAERKQEARELAREREDALRHSSASEPLESREETVEKGRKRLIEKARMGAGDATHKRLREEIDYLINNYIPSNEHKIEILIDKWRRSNDPAYDPMINVTFRNARKDHDKGHTPL